MYTLHDICDFAHGKQEELLMCGEDQDQESVARHILQHRVLYVVECYVGFAKAVDYY